MDMSNIRSLLSHIFINKKIIGFFLLILMLLLHSVDITDAQDTYTNDCWLIMSDINMYEDYGIFQKEDLIWSFNQLKSYCNANNNSTLDKDYNTDIPWYRWIMDYLLFLWEHKLLGTADQLGLDNDPMWEIYHQRKEKNKENLTWDMPAILLEEYNQIWLPTERWNIIWLRYIWSSWLQSKFLNLCNSIYVIATQWGIRSRWWTVAATYYSKKNDCDNYIWSSIGKEINITENIIEIWKNNIQNNIALWINKYNNQSANQVIQSLQNIRNKYMDSVMKVKSAGEVNICNW